MMHYAPQYVNFTEPDGTVQGAYGPRITKQLPDLINLLTRYPNTRRAVITLYQHDLEVAENAKDIPCTLSWQFMIVDDKLCMITSMRSNDAWLGFPYDVFVNTSIQRTIANFMGLDVGWYQHNVGSMHLYAKHFEAANAAIGLQSKSEQLPYQPMNLWATDIIALQACEEASRMKYSQNDYSLQGYLADFAACFTGQGFYSKVFEDAYNRRYRSSRQDDSSSQVS
jgi:thymidylate synthase